MWYISLQMDIKTGYLTDSCFWSSQMGKAVALQHATQIKMQEKMLYLATDRKIGSTYNKKKKEILGYAFYNRCKRIKRT